MGAGYRKPGGDGRGYVERRRRGQVPGKEGAAVVVVAEITPNDEISTENEIGPEARIRPGTMPCAKLNCGNSGRDGEREDRGASKASFVGRAAVTTMVLGFGVDFSTNFDG
jgi:hypothetical protein